MMRVWGWTLALGLVGCVWGCDSVPLTAPLWSESERREQASRYLSQGLRASDEGDHDRADRYLSLAALLEDQEGDGAVTVAQRLLDEGRAPKAITFLRSALDEPRLQNNPLIYGILAQVYRTQDANKEAEQATQHAEERVKAALSLVEKLSSTDEVTRRERVRQLLMAGRYCEELQGDTKTAVKLLRAAVRLGPDNPAQLTTLDRRALSTLGVVLAYHPEHADDKNESVRLTRLAAQQEPSTATFLHGYGLALLKCKDLVGARRVLREAADLDTDNAEIHYHLGQVYAGQGLYNLAAQEFDRALVLRPRYGMAAVARRALPNPLPALASDSEDTLD